MKLLLKVELLSEAAFGSGNAVPGVVDEEVLHDPDGFPYMKGKTVKGKLKEEFAHLLWCLSEGQRGIRDPLVIRFFGSPDSREEALLKFSDLCMDETLRRLFHEKIQKKELRPEEIFHGVTRIRSFTSVDYERGTAKKGSLRKIRVIGKGLYFYGWITAVRDLTLEEKQLLQTAAMSLKYLGTMETRGKGVVRCCLLKENRAPLPDVTEEELRGLKHAISCL